MGPIKIRLSDTALFGASAASREQAKAVAGACVFRASGASWEQAKAVAGACVFRASGASWEPAVALATASVTILVCVVIFLHFLIIYSCGSCVGM